MRPLGLLLNDQAVVIDSLPDGHWADIFQGIINEQGLPFVYFAELRGALQYMTESSARELDGMYFDVKSEKNDHLIDSIGPFLVKITYYDMMTSRIKKGIWRTIWQISEGEVYRKLAVCLSDPLESGGWPMGDALNDLKYDKMLEEIYDEMYKRDSE